MGQENFARGVHIPKYSYSEHGDPVAFAERYYPEMGRGKIGYFDQVLAKRLLELAKRSGDYQSRGKANPIDVWKSRHPYKSFSYIRAHDQALYLKLLGALQSGRITRDDFPYGPSKQHQFRDDHVAFAKAYYPNASLSEIAVENPKLASLIMNSGRRNEFRPV